jgi:hypothetical protein
LNFISKWYHQQFNSKVRPPSGQLYQRQRDIQTGVVCGFKINHTQNICNKLKYEYQRYKKKGKINLISVNSIDLINREKKERIKRVKVKYFYNLFSYKIKIYVYNI